MAIVNGDHIDDMAQPSSFAEVEKVLHVRINQLASSLIILCVAT